MREFMAFASPMKEYLQDFGENISIGSYEEESRNSMDHDSIELSDPANSNQKLTPIIELLKSLILIEEAKLCGFWIRNADDSMFHNDLLCFSYYQASISFDKIISRSLGLIQECAVVERGYRLAATLPPLERLERKIKNRTCANLRKCIIRNGKSLSRILNAENVRHGLEDTANSEILDLISIDSLKASLKYLSESKIDFYFELMKQEESEAYEKLSDFKDYMDCSSKDIWNTFKTVTSLENISDLKLDVSVSASDSLSSSEYLIHELYCLTLNSRQEQKSSSCSIYLTQLHEKSTKLVNDLEENLKLLLPNNSKDKTSQEQSDEEKCEKKIPPMIFNSIDELDIKHLDYSNEEEKSDKLDIFEGVAGLEIADLPARSNLSRTERIALKKQQRKPLVFSRTDFIDELKSVLNQNEFIEMKI